MAQQHPGILSNFSKVNLILLSCLFILFTFLIITEYLTGVLILLGASLILTYVLLGPVSFLEEGLARIPWLSQKLSANKRHTIAIILVYLLFFTTLALTIIRVLPPLSVQIREFAKDLPTYITRWEEGTGINPAQPNATDTNILSNILKSSLQNSVNPAQRDQLTNVPTTGAPKYPRNTYTQRKITRGYTSPPPSQPAETNMNQILTLLQHYLAQTLQYILSIGTTTITGLVYTLTSLVMVFYLLQDGRTLKNGFVNLMPAPVEAGTAEFLTRLHVQFYSFIKGQVVMSFIAGVLMYVLLSLLGIKYAFLLSVTFGIASIIPVIGPWFGLMPLVLVTAFSEHPLYIINVLFFVGIYYLLKTYWLWPRLISRHYDIHPVIFILTFLACLKTVSFLGILMSFPLATFLAGTLDFIKSKNAAKAPVSP